MSALIEAARDLAEAVESMQATFGCIQGKTPEDDDLHIHEKWAEEFLAERLAALRTAMAAAEAQPTTKAQRVHALVNAGHFPGMSEAFDAHMGAECWTDPAYRPDAATWAAAWKASKAQPVGEPVAWGGLTEGERAQAVQSICEYGTGFVAPLFAVIEGVERTLERRNTAPPAQPAAQPLTDEQIQALVLATVYDGDCSTPHRDAWAAEIGVPFARAIERAHGIGEGA